LRARGFAGGNITIPHKQAALAIVEEADEAARRIGAVNTVWLEDGRLLGTNTDWLGFAANMDDSAAGWDRAQTAVVLGAGGAARGILYALRQRGIRAIRIVNRTRAKAEALAAAFPGATAYGWEALAAALAGVDLIVNTTSLGMAGKEAMPVDLAPVASDAIVADIVYVPLETPLLRQARARGMRCVDGLGMLLHQAVPGFEKWFGVRPEVSAELRGLVIADLEAKP
jgi:shikimate dehydrogenase